LLLREIAPTVRANYLAFIQLLALIKDRFAVCVWWAGNARPEKRSQATRNGIS
jgi:hypothetical protein